MKAIVKKNDFYSCDRCKITSDTKERMIPCPRGGCEAVVIGETTVTIKTKIKKKSMKAYIQFKSQDSSKTWEDISQCEMQGFKKGKSARDFAQSLAKHLNKNVRLVLEHQNGNGIYYSPKRA